MLLFNSLFNSKTTYVKINSNWYKVLEVHETRYWIKVKGLLGSFQRGHIKKFTNNIESINKKKSLPNNIISNKTKVSSSLGKRKSTK